MENEALHIIYTLQLVESKSMDTSLNELLQSTFVRNKQNPSY